MNESVLPEFKEWPKIPRLKRDIIITEKIDGTNAQVYVGPDGAILAGSRTRWIAPGQDNYGFAQWVHQHENELRLLGEGRHYGEWWGVGIQRGYTLSERRFSLFNVKRFNETLSPEAKELLAKIRVQAVPVLYEGPFTDEAVDKTIGNLWTLGSVAAPGFKQPEGIVVYHKASGNLFKRTLESDEAPKTLAVSSAA